MPDLKLIALDTEDLNVLSAHLQDAVLRVADMAYLPKERRFAVILNRFDWQKAVAGAVAKPASSGDGRAYASSGSWGPRSKASTFPTSRPAWPCSR